MNKLSRIQKLHVKAKINPGKSISLLVPLTIAPTQTEKCTPKACATHATTSTVGQPMRHNVNTSTSRYMLEACAFLVIGNNTMRRVNSDVSDKYIIDR